MALRDCHRSTRMCGQTRGTRWYALGKILRPSVRLRPWLLEQGSLTHRLKQHYGDVEVRVLKQALGQSYHDEGWSRPTRSLVRDVVLSGHDQSLVVAHSILRSSVRGPLTLMLKRLGRQALGSLLFSRPGFIRYQREWARLDQRHSLYALAQSQVPGKTLGDLWARRASFSQIRYPSQSIQVTEVFLNEKDPA